MAVFGQCLLIQLEMRSVERGVRPIAVLYFAVIRSFFNTQNHCWSTRVQILPQRYMSLCHVTSSVTWPNI